MQCLGCVEPLYFSNLGSRRANGIPACSNIMMTSDMRACVADLGTALLINRDETASAVGFSHTHASPEVLLGRLCSSAADIYSLGILLIELTTLAPVVKRGGWRMPVAPEDCPRVRIAGWPRLFVALAAHLAIRGASLFICAPPV